MRRSVLWKRFLLPVLFIVFCGFTNVRIQNDAIKGQITLKLSELSGLSQQVQLTTARTELLLSRLAGSLGAKEQEHFSRMTRETFDGDVMYKDAVAYIENNIDSVRANLAIQMFSSPLAIKMMRLELEATTPEHRGSLGEYAQGLNLEEPSLRKRLELIKRLDEATDASVQIIKMMKGFMASTLEVLAQLAPRDKRPSDIEKKQFISQMQNKAEDYYKDAGLVLFLYAFRTINDSELELYVRMYETEEGRWFASVTRGALTDTFTKAGVRMGQKLSEVFKR